MPSRHRSENKQRRTAGDGAAFTARRKISVGVETIRRQSIKTQTRSRLWRGAGGCQSTDLRQAAVNTKTTHPRYRTTEQLFLAAR